MVRVTNSPARHRRKKKLFQLAKEFVGDRKNHLRLTTTAVMKAMAKSYTHRKLKKRDFRSLWIMRIGVAAKINGISYSKLINGLYKAGCTLNRKMLADLAVIDPQAFASVVGTAKAALV